MSLNEWRLEKAISYSELARRLGSRHATVVRRWCLHAGHKQRMIPSMRYMHMIIELTRGSVTPTDFYRNAE